MRSKLLFSSAVFSWLMLFLSWRFDHGLVIIADWAIFALGLSVWYGLMAYRSKNMKHLEHPELLR